MKRKRIAETDEGLMVPLLDESSILPLVFKRVDQLWEESCRLCQQYPDVRNYVLVVGATSTGQAGLPESSSPASCDGWPEAEIWIRDASGVREIDFEQYRALSKVDKTNPFNPVFVDFVIYPRESQVFIAISEGRMSDYGSTYRIVSKNERLELELDPDGDGYIS